MLAVAPGAVRTSPFVHLADEGAVETVTGLAYRLLPRERELLGECSVERPVAGLSAGDRELVASLVARLLLLDEGSLAAIGETVMSELDLEAAGSCNAECIFCPRDELRAGRGVGVMKAETFARVLDCFGGTLRFVGFAGIGEPTLNKALPRFLGALRDRGITTALVTNASLLDDALLAQIFDAGVGSVQVSFNGNDRASYEEHMVGLDFEVTRARLERLLARAKRAGIAVYISAIETTRHQGELEGFVEYWQARGAIAGVVPCHSRGGTVVKLVPHRGPEKGQLAARCGLFNTRSFVSWDGRVLACCHDVDGATEVGSVLRDDGPTILARKLEVMARRQWYQVCGACDEPARLTRYLPGQILAR